MVDLSTLTPAERARQLGHPQGLVGLAIAEGMNLTNRGVNEAVFRRLRLEPGQRVLELGFGNGRLLPLLMRQAENVRYVGIDISATMVEEASRFNHALIADRRAEFHHGSAEAIPFPDSSFDRAFAVAVVYFWPEPMRVLGEVRRILRSGGMSILVGLDPEVAASMAFARPEFGFRAYGADRLVRLHQEAGFDRVSAEPYEEVITRADGSTWTLRAHLFIAEA